ncbi:fimbrial protein [Shewanella algae]|uniref:fimbrial protein n=1 Tax=Shewanella algae TaxID=38313 RepID=UPI001F228C9C|nr:fimbrial protein [Shewanella algae]MCE9785985.1 type 1 fimbrial protein [Shewanella algae]
MHNIYQKVFTLVAGGMLSVGSTALAKPNAIVFYGEVAKQTCEVTINGEFSNPIVQLPTVSATELALPRSVAKETAFTLGLSGCDGAAFSSYTLFSGNNVGRFGTLKNLATTNGAANVGLQLKNKLGGYEIDVTNFQYATREPGVSLAPGETEGSWDYAVQYISIEGSATPGRVLGTVQYAVSYE